MTKQTILLTGATGFLGSHLLEALLKEQYNVVLLKRSTSNLWRINELMSQVKSYDVDTQPLELAFEEQKIDCVIHTACHYGRNDDSISEIIDSNLMFGLKVLDLCIKSDVKTFINTDTFFNSEKTMINYLSSYTLSKKQMVDWLRLLSPKIQVINMKLQHVYGPKDQATKFIPWIVKQLNNKATEINLSAGDQIRDFIFVKDVVSAYLIVLEKRKTLNDFNDFDVGTGQLVSLRFFLEQLKSVYEQSFGKISTELNFGYFPYNSSEIMDVHVNNVGLRSLGWKVRRSMKDNLKKIINEQEDNNDK